MQNDEMLTTKEAADFLKVSANWLEQLRTVRGMGRIRPPYYKIGRRVIYKKSDLNEYLNHFRVLETA